MDCQEGEVVYIRQSTGLYPQQELNTMAEAPKVERPPLHIQMHPIDQIQEVPWRHRVSWMRVTCVILVAALSAALGCLIWEKSSNKSLSEEIRIRHCEEGLQEVFGFEPETKLWFLHGSEQGKVYKVFNKQG